MPSIEAEDTSDCEQSEHDDSEYMVEGHEVLIDNKDHVGIFSIGLEDLPAHPWSLSESCADSVHDSLLLQLASESLVVDHDSWPQLGAVLFVIFHLPIQEIGSDTWLLKCGVIKSVRWIFVKLLELVKDIEFRLSPIEVRSRKDAHDAVGDSGLPIASLLDLRHIVPVANSLGGVLRLLIESLVDVLGSQVLPDDVHAMECRVVRVVSAIHTISEAVLVLKVTLAIFAGPNQVPWGHQNTVAKKFVYLGKVGKEVQSLVIGLREPKIVLYTVVWSRNVKGGKDGDLLDVAQGCGL
jgi:hypothetical protein